MEHPSSPPRPRGIRAGVRAGVRRLFRLPLGTADQAHTDADEELESFLAARVDALVAHGTGPAEARAEALRRLGGRSLDEVRERLHRSARRREDRTRLRESLDRLRQDLRFAARRLRRAPGFVAAAVVVLALGIGATTAAFSVVNAVLLEPLPYPRSDRLVRLTQTVSLAGPSPVDQSEATVLLFQRHARAFDGIAAWQGDNVDADIEPSAPGETPMRAHIARVTANLFDVLRVRPALGRGFAPGEDRAGAPRVIAISDRLWRERYRGDPGVIGRQILVNEVPRTVVAVMPPRFGYPASTVDLWIPLAWDPARARAGGFGYVTVGRLRDGESMERARADLARVITRLAEEFADDRTAAALGRVRVVPHVESLRDSIVGPVARHVWMLMASVLVVLVVACANVASLFLVRAEHAQMELAVRGALGSGTRGLTALSLAESVLLGALGGALGVLLAAAGVGAAVRAGRAWSFPRLDEVGVDLRTLLFALGTTALCALSVSLLPLLRARRVPIALVLRAAGRGPGGDPSRQRARNGLVIAQTALALVLVASSGLMTRSLLRLEGVRPGFVADDVAVTRLVLPIAKYNTAARARFLQDVLDRLRAAPGVREASVTDWVPLGNDRWRTSIEVEDRPLPPTAAGATHLAATVDGRYFATVGIPLLRGRTFGSMDEASRGAEVIVSRAFARRYWPGASPLGRRIRALGGSWRTVVGEVGDVHYEALDRPVNDIVYFPVAGGGGAAASVPAFIAVLARSHPGRAPATVAAIRDIVRALDPAMPTFGEGTLDEVVRRASARARALVVLLAVASAVALTLGAVGLYGVVAYGVTVRRREIGVRIALGARPADVRRAVSLGGLRLAAVGAAIGLACAIAFTQLLRGMLYEVSPTDPWVLGLTAVVLLVVAFVASWVPARRAAAVDPAEVLGSA